MDQPADVPIQVIDDGTTSFLLLSSPPASVGASIPFALAIDLERYTQWLVQACPDARKEGIRIEVLPQLRSQIAGWRLLDTSGMCALWFDHVEEHAHTTLTAFSVTAPSFSLSSCGGLARGSASAHSRWVGFSGICIHAARPCSQPSLSRASW